jgi:two-component system chemotaxis response regulator CheB
MPARELIVIGTSAGGVEALTVIVRGLPLDLAAAVLIVLHTSPQGPSMLPEVLSAAGRSMPTSALLGLGGDSDGPTAPGGYVPGLQAT